jgi:DNA polymerase I
MEKEKKLFLLDAYALIFRSYYAFIRNPRYTSKGLNTSAIFGFTNTLLEILQNEKPSHIAVVFDPPGPTFRNEMFPPYKANREETPEDIKKSLPYIKEIIEAFNIKIVEVNGFEADDVIGTLSLKASDMDFKVFMMTPDKDYCQLVNHNVFVYKPKKGGNDAEIMGSEEVKVRYGVASPLNVIDILALMGDSSDNVPGAPGIGEKTAMKLIGEYTDIDNLYKHIDELKGKQKETLINFKDQVMLSKKLVTIDLNVPLSFDPISYELISRNDEKINKIFQELEFNMLLQRIQGISSAPKASNVAMSPTLFDNNEEYVQMVKKTTKNIENIPHDYRLVENLEDINNLINSLMAVDELCFDTETTDLDWFNAELVGLALSVEKGKAFYVPFPSNRQETQKKIDLFRPILENSKIRKVGQNIKYDILVLSNYNIHVKGEIFDTLVAHYLLQPELKHNMDYLANIYLDYSPVSIETLIGPKGKNQTTMRSVPLEKIKEYAGEDADITLQLKEKLYAELNTNKLMALARDLEMPLTNVLANIEQAGFSVDVGILKNYAVVLQKEAIEVEQKIYSLAGMEFNIASARQLGEVLFNRIKIEANAKLTKTKQYSTSEETLMRLREKHPIIDQILEYRSLKKLLSTYVETLPNLINPGTGKIHTSFNQAVAATGRLSSNRPNLQNIPIREERGKEIRKAFIPSLGEYTLLAADYSQIELRLMAHMSNDSNMISAFSRGEDIHAATAANIYKVPLSEVTQDMRRKAKTANFGIIYGISAFGLSQRLSIPRGEAKELIDGYFESFPDVKKYMDESIKQARESGFVETIMGRRRYLKDINSRNSVVRGVAERNAINAPIQGSAADIIKLAMVKIFEAFHVKQLRSKMILQVHDELIFDVYNPEIEEVKIIVRKEMEQALSLKVPLDVDMGLGNNWLEAH